MKKFIVLFMAIVITVSTLSGCINPFAVSGTSDEAEVTETHSTSTAVTTQAPTTTVAETTKNPTEASTQKATKAPTTTVSVKETTVEAIVTEPLEKETTVKKPVQDNTEPATSSKKPESNMQTKPPKTTEAPDKAEKPPKQELDKNYKYIAFTFDDGPHYELTYMFADKLKEYGGRGTFFVVGNRMDTAGTSAVKYAYDLGNEIAVHGYTHTKYYDTCNDETFKAELSKTASAIKSATGVTPTLMRPIGGAITDKRIKSCGYDVVLWNVDTQDWRYSYRGNKEDAKANIKQIYGTIMTKTDENDIILMHEIYYNTYDAFSLAIDKLYKQGYRFVTVSELLGRDETSKGNLYYSAD